LKARRFLPAIGIVLLFIIGLFLLGVFVDINIILKYNKTPVSFTVFFPFCGVVIGSILAWKIFYKKK